MCGTSQTGYLLISALNPRETQLEWGRRREGGGKSVDEFSSKRP